MQGLGTFVRRFVRPGKGQDAETVDKWKRLALLHNPDLKAIALMALHVGYDKRPDVATFVQQQLNSLGTNATAIRTRWALAADHLGSALSANNDHENALVCLAKSLEILPDEVVTLSHLAIAQFKAGDPAAAIATLQKAIAIKPSTANLYFQRAQIHMQLQQIPQAIESLQQGLQYAPEDRTAKFLLEKLRTL
jgi:tetratricopeptide (TPR) repeat protein